MVLNQLKYAIVYIDSRFNVQLLSLHSMSKARNRKQKYRLLIKTWFLSSYLALDYQYLRWVRKYCRPVAGHDTRVLGRKEVQMCYVPLICP
jgi:hypothetical protein